MSVEKILRETSNLVLDTSVLIGYFMDGVYRYRYKR